MRFRTIVFGPLLAATLLTAAGNAATPGQNCEKKAAAALRTCAKAVAKQQLKCVKTTTAACTVVDAKVLTALATLETKVRSKCPDDATVTAAGYEAPLTLDGLVDRLQEACTSLAESAFARSFGGPHAAVRAAASPDDQACLDDAYTRARRLIDYAAKQQSKCVTNTHAGLACDPATVATKIATRQASTTASITSKCVNLATLVAVDPATFVARALDQAGCTVATAHGDTGPLALTCGPRAAVPVPALATPTQVVLDNNTWGTRCGDGSPYAFWIRLAPAGQPVNRVVVHMQGGGACTDGPDCASTSPGLFESLDDNLATGGILSNTDAANPYRDWTKVFLPYCTQDLHIGGGVTNTFTEITVERYGARNTRAALQYLRDVLWASMAGTDPEGYRPDRIQMMLSGSSAGGYGAVYNYHWVLDDLRWVHTAAVPDAALGMDNGTGGVILLGALALLPTSPGWGVQPYLPPYCQSASCAEIFTNLEAAHSPRLLGVPEQQILNVTNQIDNVQRNTTLFASTADFVNTLRSSHCDIQGSNGIRSFLRASSTSIHGQLANGNYQSGIVGGTSIAAWLGGVISAPGSVIDKVATGTLETSFPGVNPFPCSVGSPSGAFVE